MVHNGIEYGIMQTICEAYDIFKNILGLSGLEIRDIFAEWNSGDLGSFLLEISIVVLGKIDPETNQPLVDLVLDTAEQKGTGKWTAQDALDLGAPVPTLTAAVIARIISGAKEERVAASEVLRGRARNFPAIRSSSSPACARPIRSRSSAATRKVLSNCGSPRKSTSTT